MRNLEHPGRSPVHSRHGMACTSHTDASQTALDVLKAGGNALDAAIAACAMQCVVEPGSTGIGGDCFAMYAKGGSGQPIAYNGSGRAPAAATVDALAALGVDKLERGSPHSVIIPGAVDAWAQLHADHGHMPFNELLQPAINTARHGYALSSRVRYDLSRQVDYLSQFPRTRDIFLDNGKLPAEGQVRQLPLLADALEAIATQGRDVFYRGHLAQGMLDELNERGGLHVAADFANARGEYVTPIKGRFRDHDVYQCPPNGQGVIALLMLNMMSKLSHQNLDLLSVERMHQEIETCRLAYRTRDRWLADPVHSDVPVDAMLGDAYAAALVAAIDPKKATVPPSDVDLPPHQDTVYIAVVDKDRNVCSFINTLFWIYGSGITSRDGITFTNRGMGFVLDPTSPNCIAPNKRPLHTIIPAMAMRDDRVELCFGVMGGEYQAMGHQQFLTRYYDYGCDIQEAMDKPRFMANPFTDEVEVESTVDKATCDALRAMGHNIVPADNPIGGSQAIAIDWQAGVLTGGSDPRKDGCAAGY